MQKFTIINASSSLMIFYMLAVDNDLGLKQKNRDAMVVKTNVK